MSLSSRAILEFMGTFWLVLGGCGSAVLAAAFPHVGIGLLGVALAFGLTVLTMAYAIGHMSGCHLNPAVSFGLVVAGRFRASELPAYVIAQLLGAILAAFVLYLIASGGPSFDMANGFASNGYGAHSPGHYGLPACLLCELVMSFMFVIVVLGSTDAIANKSFAAIAVGLALTLVHLVSVPVTNTSVNPARSIGPALFEGGWALGQLWLFVVAPLVGGVLAGLAYPALVREKPSARVPAPPPAEPLGREVSGPREPLPTA